MNAPLNLSPEAFNEEIGERSAFVEGLSFCFLYQCVRDIHGRLHAYILLSVW